MKKIIIILLLSFWNITFSQEPNDCENAITICGNGTFSSNATGFGAIQEVSSCGGMEHNSIWLKVNIVQSGNLGFNIIPHDPDLVVDYDFWVYGPNTSCTSLGSAERCSTTNPLQVEIPGSNNHTGINGSNTATTQTSFEGQGYVYWLPVLAGQSYYIVIDRPVGDGGFDLEWTGTAMNGTGAFAPPPTANDIVDMRTCSNNPNVGIFDLNNARPQINTDLVNNTITFHTTLENAFDNVAPIGPIMANATNPQQIFARVTNNVTGCSTITDFDLKVFPVPTATITASDTAICSGVPVDITISGTPEATIDYTVNNGSVQSVTLDTTGAFTFTSNPIIDTEYTLVSAKILGFNNNVICSQAISDDVTIVVTPNVTPTFTQVLPICPGETLSALPTTSNNGVAGTWSPALNNTVTTTYTFTPDAGICALNATMEIVVNTAQNADFTQVAPICQGETLSALPTTSNNGITGTWSPALDNNATTTYTFTPNVGQCSSPVTMEIVVNLTQIATFTQVAPICQGENLLALPTTSNNGVTGTWLPALNNNATTTYTFTPDTGQCSSPVTMEIIVNLTQIANFTQVAPICQGETLSALPSTSTNGVTGTWSPVLDNTATTTYTFTPDPGQCSSNVMMQIVVNPYPILASDEYEICNPDASGFGAFDLQGNIPIFIGNNQNPANFNVVFSKDASNTVPINTNPYTNTTQDTEIIYITITNALTGCVITEPLTLIVEDGTQVTKPADVAICDREGENDGIATFNLEDFNLEILNGQNPADFQITYHLTAFTAQTGTNAIQNPTEHKNTASPYLQAIFIRVENINSTNGCIGLTDVNLIVEPILKPRIITGPDNNNTICVNYQTGVVERSLTLFSYMQNPSYTYKWFLNGTEIPGATSGSYEIITASPGLYTLEIIDSSSTSICTPEPSEVFEVIQSGSAIVLNVATTNAFNDQNTITVEVEGFGEYWFQLDYGPIMDNNGIFTSVSPGLHTVYVYDRKTEKPSCDAVMIKDIRIIDYPKFFTPNGDGFNDTWNIGGLDEQLKLKIYIFDRYGKLITEIRPSGDGWDGSFNGQNLPATDYWFLIHYEEQGIAKEFKAHFSLKR